MDVISVGNAMIDAFLHVQEKNMHARIDKEKKEICFKYGEKIHVDSCEFLAGGNACNVAVGLGRQGYASGLCAQIGDDEFAQKLIVLLKKEPVDISLVKKTSHAPSSFAVGIQYEQERTLFVEHVKREHDFSFTGVTPNWFYVTSLGNEWESAYSRVVEYVKAHGTKLAFSPGTHQLEAGYEAIKEIIAAATILFVNKDEAKELLKSDGDDIETLLSGLSKLGPKVVSITDGENGAYAKDASGILWKIAIFPNALVERTGAGDAYTTGFLSAYMKEADISQALRYGAVNAGSVIEYTGAQKGLLTKEQIRSKLEQVPEFAAERLV
ncbi:MAG: carbohydrate kinase family protein [Candidatus Levybacteria bacterium]|nr:carbohydrate kinase family protein [Candidatus Levybacteria bacterium]